VEYLAMRLFFEYSTSLLSCIWDLGAVYNACMHE
jgi:hypothetical protein